MTTEMVPRFAPGDRVRLRDGGGTARHRIWTIIREDTHYWHTLDHEPAYELEYMGGTLSKATRFAYESDMERVE